MAEPNRCPWAKTGHERDYHDTEWCRPLHDDGKLFEFLILEGMQAGLSWRTVLEKREAMRAAFTVYAQEVKGGTFPAEEHCYSLEDEAELLEKLY